MFQNVKIKYLMDGVATYFIIDITLFLLYAVLMDSQYMDRMFVMVNL